MKNIWYIACLTFILGMFLMGYTLYAAGYEKSKRKYKTYINNFTIIHSKGFQCYLLIYNGKNLHSVNKMKNPHDTLEVK